MDHISSLFVVPSINNWKWGKKKFIMQVTDQENNLIVENNSHEWGQIIGDTILKDGKHVWKLRTKILKRVAFGICDPNIPNIKSTDLKNWIFICS